MQQVINLINTLPQKPKVKFPAIYLMVGLSCVLSFWGIVYGILGAYHNHLYNESKAIQKDNRQLSQKIKRNADSKFQRKRSQLKSELDEVRQKIERHKQLAGVVKQQSGWENKGFVPFMQLLAETLPHKAWLEGIDVMQGGQTIRLQGKTLEPKVMPNYVQQLNGESLLNDIGLELSLVNIEKVQKNNMAVYQFDIKSD